MKGTKQFPPQEMVINGLAEHLYRWNVQQATEQAEQLQPVSKLNKQEVLTLVFGAVALFASGFLN